MEKGYVWEISEGLKRGEIFLLPETLPVMTKSCRKIWLPLILKCFKLHIPSATSNATSPSRF